MQAETHTISSEDVAPLASNPGHVLKAKQGGIHTQAGAAFPDATYITRANPGQQRDCKNTAQQCHIVLKSKNKYQW